MKGDSQLIIKQVRGDCSCNNLQVAAYLIHVRKLENDFDALELQHVPRELNSAADDLSARASVAKMASHAIFQYNVLVIDIDNTTLGLI